MKTFQTREQMMEVRRAAERAAMQKTAAARTPAIRASRVTGGVKMVIVDPTPDMRQTMDAHGFALETDLSNTYARICATPEELTVVQNAVRAFFGR